VSFIPGMPKRGPHDALDLLMMLHAGCPHCGPAIADAIRAAPPPADLNACLAWHDKMRRYGEELEQLIIEMAEENDALRRDLRAMRTLAYRLKTKPSERRSA
jgi:hypothetical protein